ASDARELVALARALAKVRLDRDANDLAARELRALATLAEANGPLVALAPGPLAAGVGSSVAPDLEAAARLPGRAGARAAWLLADRLLIDGREVDARAALERAQRNFPDAALASAFERIFAAPPDEHGFEAMLARVQGSPGERVAAAAELARFLARLGAAEAIADPRLAGSSDDAALE